MDFGKRLKNCPKKKKIWLKKNEKLRLKGEKGRLL